MQWANLNWEKPAKNQNNNINNNNNTALEKSVQHSGAGFYYGFSKIFCNKSVYAFQIGLTWISKDFKLERNNSGDRCEV